MLRYFSPGSVHWISNLGLAEILPLHCIKSLASHFRKTVLCEQPEVGISLRRINPRDLSLHSSHKPRVRIPELFKQWLTHEQVMENTSQLIKADGPPSFRKRSV
jgi:hypothetical protein